MTEKIDSNVNKYRTHLTTQASLTGLKNQLRKQHITLCHDRQNRQPVWVKKNYMVWVTGKTNKKIQKHFGVIT